MGKIDLGSITLDSGNFQELADFYAKLLHGRMEEDNDMYSTISIPDSSILLCFQNAVGYQPPTWPEEPEKQQQMVHLDFSVDNLDEAIRYAIDLGAKKAPQQFIPQIVVMLDPAGHPFCLCPKSE